MRKSKNRGGGTVSFTNKCDLLIVEDEESLRHFIGKMIQDRFPNLRIQFAGDGLEGLEKVKVLKPHIVWTCVKMPRMSGLELIELIRKNPDLNKTKILVWTGCYTMKDVKNHILELGVDVFLPKSPGTIEEALSAITAWVL
jgi:CheY-like chemotaxis protein